MIITNILFLNFNNYLSILLYNNINQITTKYKNDYNYNIILNVFQYIVSFFLFLLSNEIPLNAYYLL